MSLEQPARVSENAQSVHIFAQNHGQIQEFAVLKIRTHKRPREVILGFVKSSPEIEAIVRRRLAAQSRGDAGLVTSLNSSSDNLWIVGSDQHEWHSGAEASQMTRAHTAELATTYDSELLRVYAFEQGNVGWAVVEERRTYPTGRARVFRITYVFELEAGSWKVVHSHFSAPVSNLELWGVELTRTLSDLVDSLDAESDLSAVPGTSTLVFTDIVDSTALLMSLGETSWLDVINRHLDTLRGLVEAEGGSVVKTLGDGGMYAFASGTAALKAATRIQKDMADRDDPTLEIRIGVHTGDVLQTEGDFFGSTVAKAARVAAAADGGQILVSSTTAGLVNASEFAFGDPITVELKGLDGTHQLRPLIWS